MQNVITKERLLEANFGIEREGLRVAGDGSLSLKKHPEAFGDKNENPYITTDFSESQLELITPVFSSSNEAVGFLDSLYNIAVSALQDEFIWPQSMPAITPEDVDIPLAVFDQERGSQKDQYRAYLMDKYGGKKQLISGIHINFSFSDRLLKTLHKESANGQAFPAFKNGIYLKLSRNFLRYNWLLVYLLGAANTLHKTYDKECVNELDQVNAETYSDARAVSFRNSSCGYQNKEHIILDYGSIETYVKSIQEAINTGVIANMQELYSPIRLKGKKPQSLDQLMENGIEYVELRSIDVNPFLKSGLSKDDLDFIHVFLLFCLFKQESEYEGWQTESIANKEMAAKRGLDFRTELLRDGKAVSLCDWGEQILEEILQFVEDAELPFIDLVKEKLDVLNHPEKTYSYRISELCKKSGYIGAHMNLAKKYKEEARQERFRLTPYTDLELSTQILLKESIKRGISFDILDRKENFIALQKGQKTEYVKQATKTSKDQYISFLIMENKSVTKKILAKNNISTPSGEEFQQMGQALGAVDEWIGRPVVVKPKSTNFGLGISVFSEGTDQEGLAEAFRIAFKEDTSVLIEPFIKGKEYRFLTIGDETAAVLHRVPANVKGDGRSSIADLIAQKNLDDLRGEGYKTPLEIIQIDDNMRLFLRQHGLTINSVLPDGKVQYLRENSNISTGGDSIDVTDVVPPYYKEIAVQAAKCVGANICGVDMIIEDLESPSHSYSIIELNFNPAIHIHSYPYEGKERNIAGKILELLEL
ncbi:bifunctional glutamate--cysteine ligase GshA/glutathione synthetase GshB [Bacillus testis]|uniref:bifunctional glutamate--cysteine ligase GshA/glutathione synthetase GshB n=1 Tax=Bacillus testis TaxID=1622072 RepID=UPI00067F5074|nr:bifunctional glutamate--cysteine ligase GshA/glutathione synthetase GshB [Bacillus testis]